MLDYHAKLLGAESDHSEIPLPLVLFGTCIGEDAHFRPSMASAKMIHNVLVRPVC